MVARLIRAASLATPVLFALGCASFTTPPTYGLDADSATLVRQTCNDIMGLRVGPEYEACTGSLADSVRVVQDAKLTAQADAACEQQGLKQGTPELAKCVVLFRRENSAAPLGITQAASEVQSWKSYFSMSDAQKVERAEISCAQLGLHPSWGAFDYCVTDLRHSILTIRELSLP